MLTFIIPLKSKRSSSSWETVCKLFERTLRSICNQTVSDYQVVVVCHDQPEIEFNPLQVTYISVNLPFPGDDYASKERDKMLKMQAGLVYAKSLNSNHIMFVDADDCISKHIVEFANSHPHENGWFLAKGFDFREDIQRLRARNKGLHLRTNSSHIIRLDLLEQELELGFEQIKRGDCVLYHIDTAKILKQRGTPLKPLPFRGVIYITDNGENMWWSQSNLAGPKQRFVIWILNPLKEIYQKILTEPINDNVFDEFGLYPL